MLEIILEDCRTVIDVADAIHLMGDHEDDSVDRTIMSLLHFMLSDQIVICRKIHLQVTLR